MPNVVASEVAFPGNYYSQAELERAVVSMAEAGLTRFEPARIRRLFRAVRVRGRHLALPLEQYLARPGFGERNLAWQRVGLELAERAVSALFERVGATADEVGLLMSTTVTGVATPSLEARLMNKLAFSRTTRRLPLFGLGCVAGAAGVARTADFLRGQPHGAALLLSVELCSLTVQLDDGSMANLISSGLFGDGAAAVLMVGDEHRLANGNAPAVVDSESVFFPQTERVMGWDVGDGGFRIVLSNGVPELARTALPEVVRAFLNAHELSPANISTWIAHPGGPAVLDALEWGLELPPTALMESRRSLEEVGNMSSASVLAVLKTELLRAHRPGDYGLLLAMGPGFCAELVLLKW